MERIYFEKSSLTVRGFTFSLSGVYDHPLKSTVQTWLGLVAFSGIEIRWPELEGLLFFLASFSPAFLRMRSIVDLFEALRLGN